jgi:RNA polymerase sigma-70 factor (ECF subfamily)
VRKPSTGAKGTSALGYDEQRRRDGSRELTEPGEEQSEGSLPNSSSEGSSVGRSIEHLMEAYQQADADAVTELVRMASPPLLRYFLGHTRSMALAEDLLQDTWLRVHRARHTYRPGLRVLPWLFAIAEHTRIDGYRKWARTRQREVAVDQLPELSPPAQAPASAHLDVHRMLEQLPEGQKEVILLLKFSGLSLEEVARIKGSTTGAIKLKAHRAYETLRSMLSGKEKPK